MLTTLLSSKDFPTIQSNEQLNFYEIRAEVAAYYDSLITKATSDKTQEVRKIPGLKQFKRWENFWESRVYPTGEFPDYKEIYDTYLNDKVIGSDDEIQSPDNMWSLIGPNRNQVNRLSYEHYGVGRLNVVKFNPANPSEVWIGSAAGGLWKSTNSGVSWEIIKNTDLISIGISDIDINRSNPNIMYVATGDNNAFWMTNGYTIGLLKSKDGGKTFTFTNKIHNRNESVLMHRVLSHPQNPDLVLLSTNRGMFRTTDGGKNWESTELIATTGDMEHNPSNPNVILATTKLNGGGGEIFKSVDFGKTWNKVLTFGNAVRIELEFATADPNVAYALGSLSNGGFAGIYKTMDFGETWEIQSTTPNIHNGSVTGTGADGQGFYNIAMAVHPTNSNEVYSGGINIWKSPNGGANWEILTHWWGQSGTPFSHADHHFMAFQPGTGSLFAVNDGGVFVSTNKGNSWESRNMGLSIMQFYGLSYSKNHSNLFLGGTQDNGTIYYRNGSWYTVWGGDGMQCMIDYTNPDIIYATNPNGVLSKSTNGGTNFRTYIFTPSKVSEHANWNTCMAMDPLDPNTIYVAYVNLWKSTDGGDSFNRISNLPSGGSIDALEISETNPKVIFIAKGRNLFRTIDGGDKWQSLGFADGIITDIEIDENNTLDAWISLSGYSDNKVIHYKDEKMVNISSNIPRVPVNTIQRQTEDPGYLYVGTDLGVYYYNFSTGQWQVFKKNLPAVVVSDIIIDNARGKIYAATFARGLWETDLLVCNLDVPVIKVIGDLTICEGDSTLLRIEDKGYKEIRWSNGDSGNFTYAKKKGNHFVLVKDESDCFEISKNVYLNVMDFAELKISKSANSFCVTDEIELSVPDEYVRYEWSTGETTNKIMIAEPGFYWLEVENSFGCVHKTEPFEIKEKALPEIPKVLGDFEICEDDTAFIYLNKYHHTIEWNTGYTGDTLKVTQEGAYFAIVYDENGCFSSTDTVYVEVFDKAVPAINYPGIIESGLCDGDAVSLTADDQYSSVFWSTGETSLEISIEKTGQYFYKGITQNGCNHYSDTLFVQFNPNPEAPSIVRRGDSIFIENLSPYYEYQWYFNSQPVSEEKGGRDTARRANLYGDYEVEVTNEYGCKNMSNKISVILSVEQYYPNSSFVVTPNPSTGIFEINMKGIRATDILFEVMDLSARTLKTYTYQNIVDNLLFSIDLTNFSSGLYYLRSNIDGQEFIEKLIRAN